MMENPTPEEENVIKNISNYYYIIIKNLFEYEKEKVNHYKPVRVSTFWSKSYIEYESNGDRSNTLSVEEYLNKIRTYLKDTINSLKKSDT